MKTEKDEIGQRRRNIYFTVFCFGKEHKDIMTSGWKHCRQNKALKYMDKAPLAIGMTSYSGKQAGDDGERIKKYFFYPTFCVFDPKIY
jgi:hypothetical protein